MRGLAGGKTTECRGDLVARERKGALSGADCLALRAHLAECQSCRLARQVFVDLDHVSGVDPGDGARIERMSTAARRWGHHRSRPASRLWKGRPRLRALALAAVLVMLGGTASATVWWWRHIPVLETSSATVPDSVSTKRAHRSHRRGAETFDQGQMVQPQDTPVLPATASDLLVPPDIRPSGVEPRRPRQKQPVLSQVSRDEALSGPARLLRQASDARRNGDADRAMGLYRKLQRRFPRSSEAVLSAVPLGGLLLDRRLPRAALGQFDAYLASSHGGGLIPEALYGRGRALASLGDRREERQTWDRLLADFPDGAYGPTARRRLSELK